MDFRNLNNQQFFTMFQSKVADERRITTEVLLFFREAERRMLYAEFGRRSLLAFAIQDLKYSEPAANRRISAMRVLKDVPEIEEKIQSGELSLTTVTQASTFFRQSAQHTKTKTTLEEKREVLKSIENQSCRQTERTLIEKCPELRPLIKEKSRAVAGGATQVTTVLEQELMETLEEIQNLLGKKMELKDLLKHMADDHLARLRKQRGLEVERQIPDRQHELTPSTPGKSNKTRAAQPAPKVKPKQIAENDQPTAPKMHPTLPSQKIRPYRNYIPVEKKRILWRRSQARCEWIDPITGRRCEERCHLEIDHLVPFALGGTEDIENLQLVCQTHNKLRALKAFGPNKMSRYMPSLRSQD